MFGSHVFQQQDDQDAHATLVERPSWAHILLRRTCQTANLIYDTMQPSPTTGVAAVCPLLDVTSVGSRDGAVFLHHGAPGHPGPTSTRIPANTRLIKESFHGSRDRISAFFLARL